MISNRVKFILAFLILTTLSGCLMTRGEVGESDQSRVYGKKTAQNQESQLSTKAQASVDERDELIRSLNGRVEALENQLAQAQKDKSQAGQADQQKTQALQEALIKMEAQLARLESEMAQKNAAAQVAAQQAAQQQAHTPTPVTKIEESGDKNKNKNTKKSDNTYDIAQGFFANKDWKKAILNYQKYVDENPKGKEVADSKYKIGASFQELGMKEEAMAFFEEVIAQFSKSEAAKKAKIRLSKLKK